jgi:hypothetical protein
VHVTANVTASAASAPVRPAPREAIGSSDDAGAQTAPSTLAEERALVERGRAALARRDGVSALEAFREHARKFPSGQLEEERDALVVQALGLAGHPDEARQKARQFEQRYPQSVFWPRVEETLRQLP